MDQLPALTATNYREIIRGLDEAIAVYERHVGSLNVMDLRSKSILMAVRSELRERVASEDPFGFRGVIRKSS